MHNVYLIYNIIYIYMYNILIYNIHIYIYIYILFISGFLRVKHQTIRVLLAKLLLRYILVFLRSNYTHELKGISSVV